MDFLLAEEKEVREAAANTIGHLITFVKPEEYARLDEECRPEWYQSGGELRWHSLAPPRVEDFRALPYGTIMIGLASFHKSGFVRQAAVNELSKISDGLELPFLLVRLNDWVDPVRESAAKAVLQRAGYDYGNHFYRNLPLVMRLDSCQRIKDDGIQQSVRRLLQTPASASIVKAGLNSTDRWLRRQSAQIILTGTVSPDMDLLRLLLTNRDPIVRLWAARRLPLICGGIMLTQVLAKLGRDRFAPIRREVLDLMARENNATTVIENALLDSNASVRDIARYWIKKLRPDYDFRERYRQWLDSSPVCTRVAIFGLAESGTVEDVERVVPFLASDNVSWKRAAVYALAQLNGKRFTEQFLNALADENPGISKEARFALARMDDLPVERLQTMFKAQSSPHVRKNVFHLLGSQSFWNRGVFFFEALRDHDDRIVQLGANALRGWIRKSGNMGTAPTPSDLRQLQDSLKASAGLLSPHDAEELQFALQAYQ
jgi:HEAT repeat protein